MKTYHPRQMGVLKLELWGPMLKVAMGSHAKSSRLKKSAVEFVIYFHDSGMS